jgi:hypothetical protein
MSYGECIQCGRKTSRNAKICNGCYRDEYDEQGVSGMAQKYWDEQRLTEHRERLNAHRHRVQLEEAAMRVRGKDPNND